MRRFALLGLTPAPVLVGGMAPVWPIGEYLARIKLSRRLAKRVRRLNPNGKAEGGLPLGITIQQHREGWLKRERRR